MTRLQIVLVLAVAVALTIVRPYGYDFQVFYHAGQNVLHGVNPYTDSGYFNPIHVALVAAPLSLVPYELAVRLNAGLIFAVYAVALYRLTNRRVWAIAMLASFWLANTFSGNLDAWVLLGATLPAPVGVWLLLVKPQIGLFAAAIMLWKYRDWRLIVAVGIVLAASLALGMIHGGLDTKASVAVWPYGLIVGVPMLLLAWRRRDTVIALGASVCLSPYVNAVSWCAALPLFRINRRVMTIGVVLSWVLWAIWRSGPN